MNYADNAYAFRQDATFLHYFGPRHARPGRGRGRRRQEGSPWGRRRPSPDPSSGWAPCRR
ncbi:MAG: hypothetical protein MZV70_69225 [Desulfobacterales bacterium]|nr:hypothetical protein [Desulfobacterales bacterium]